MPFPIAGLLGASLLAKGIGGLFGNRSKKKKAQESKRATTAGLNIQQKQREDSRRARLQLGASLLGGVPGTTAGGGVRTNVGLDPELVRQLGVERTYDFGSAVPDESAGGGSAFLSGLFGGIGDTIPYMMGGGGGGAMAAGVAGEAAGGAAGGPLGGMGGGAAGMGGGASAAGAGGLSLDDLMEFLNTRKPGDDGLTSDYGDM